MAKGKRTSIYFDREKQSFVGLTDSIIEELKKQYPTIDFDHEHIKMTEWMASSKGKKRTGDIRFIKSWLSDPYGNCKKLSVEIVAPLRDQTTTDIDTPLRPYITEYLRELWKGREFLLEINKTMP